MPLAFSTDNGPEEQRWSHGAVFTQLNYRKLVFMSLFNRHFRVTCVSDSIPAPGGRLDLPFLELVFVGFDRRLHVEPSQCLNVPVMEPFLLRRQIHCHLGSRLGGGNHFTVLGSFSDFGAISPPPHSAFG